MLKQLIVIAFIALGVQLANAQQDNPFGEVPDHTPMMNDTWETINKLMYKVTYKDNQTIYTPHFPDELKAIDKQTVTLPGYLVPMQGGRDHETFMLSVLPIMQCMFCGQGDIPPMVEIFMKKGTKVRFTEEPIKIRGRVRLNPDTQEGNSEIQILDAELIQ
ncbi:hypothetical protein JHJ32_17505 [Parapedobacter sp. ISTM3]|uniref:DUF3299 domain-containing protein n=1 Tax=Parapedobacter luteus TaxID=623280 RepID=A0A1T5AHI2_9SPHI|nr:MULTISPECIES: hypothetical protein [Parapedobacter]MBK1441800.1 hypothetical protein [Parapedobacter sp. ISTM3]SKB34461.1 hypothetical protein SAMN05660226_00769 [Parapedobacter luteus]